VSLQGMTGHGGEWLRGTGPQSDVVLSSRVRLARNVAGFPFVNRCSRRQLHELLERCQQEVMSGRLGQRVLWMDLGTLNQMDRHWLVERHLISRQHAEGGEDRPRGVAVGEDETFAVMVNEEDHLRVQVLRSGLQLEQAYQHVDEIDDQLESRLAMAYSPRWGYLAACPTNVGTGIRVSVMLHLPALRLTGEIEKVQRAARDMQLAVRGFYGEGSEASGDLYQISNQMTLGHSEREILEKFQSKVVPQIVSYEQQARQALLRQRPAQLDDQVWRAWAILTHARVLGADEVLVLLSHLRLGVNLGRLTMVDVRTVNELFILTQPAHLQKLAGRQMDQMTRREARAKLVRERLGVVAGGGEVGQQGA